MEQQNKRFYKLDYESFLLKVEKNDLGFLNVLGSTKNIYTVQINKNSRKLECDCPMQRLALHFNCLCKHICFILLEF